MVRGEGQDYTPRSAVLVARGGGKIVSTLRKEKGREIE